MEDNIGVSESEGEARKFGWVPQEDFKGNPDEWRDADEFLKRGREINGFLRKDLDKLRSQNGSLEAQLGEMKSTLQEFKKYHEQTEERAMKRALEELKLQKKQAIADGDGEKVVEIEDQIDEIRDAQTKATKNSPETPQKPQTDAEQQRVFQEWNQENSWFGKDRVATALANDLALDVRREFPNLQGYEFLEKVKEAVKKELPEAFENKTRRSSAVDSSGSTRPSSKKKSYADLPADAKAACDKYVKQGLLKQEDYVRDYFAD